MRNGIGLLTLSTALLLVASTAVFAQKTADIYLRLGIEQISKKDYDAAINSFTECLKVNPTYDSCRLNRGLMYYEKKNYEASIADYTEIIRVFPNRDNPYIRRALAYSALKKYDLALSDFRASLKINPNNELVKKMVDELLNFKNIEKKEAELGRGITDLQRQMPKPTESCQLTLKDSPVFGGVQLGMKKSDFDKIFSGSEYQQTDGRWDWIDPNIEERKGFENIRRIKPIFLKEKLSRLEVEYNSSAQKISDFVFASSLAEIFKIPYELWEHDTFGEKKWKDGTARMFCKDFKMYISALLNQFILSNLTAPEKNRDHEKQSKSQ